MDTELVKKATILFSHAFYERLATLAEQRKSSVGHLVREACRVQYSITPPTERLGLVQELAALQLPVGTVDEMERESVEPVEPLP